MKNNIFLSLFVVFLCSVLIQDTQSKGHGNSDSVMARIAGGWETSIEMHPYQVYLGNSYVCGGSIISPRFILTAAHCIVILKILGNGTIEIRAGSTYSDGRGTLYTSKRAIIHPLYNSSTHDYDVGLIDLQQNMNLNGKTTKEINLPPLGSSSVKTDTPLLVSGWGLINRTSHSIQLRAVVVPTVSHEYCSRAFSLIKAPVTARMFCAGPRDGLKNSCPGDSGSPAVDETSGLQIGVVSWGFPRCPPLGYPVVYSDLSNKEIRSWIQLIAGI